MNKLPTILVSLAAIVLIVIASYSGVRLYQSQKASTQQVETSSSEPVSVTGVGECRVSLSFTLLATAASGSPKATTKSTASASATPKLSATSSATVKASATATSKTSTPTSKATSTPSATEKPGLPAAGIGIPTVIGITFGALLLLGALLLAL